jgi:hypothetical protein
MTNFPLSCHFLYYTALDVCYQYGNYEIVLWLILDAFWVVLVYTDS